MKIKPMKPAATTVIAFVLGYQLCFYTIGYLVKHGWTGHLKANAMSLPYWIYLLCIIVMILTLIVVYFAEKAYDKEVKELGKTVNIVLEKLKEKNVESKEEAH